MAKNESEVVIALAGTVDDRAAEGPAARVRAALQNGIRRIVLEADPSAHFVSEAFFGFLAAAAGRTRKDGGVLVFRGGGESTRQRLALARLDSVLTVE